MISLEELIAFAKQRGWIYQSSEIYDGVAGIYDFGPLGVLLKRNIESLWWRNTVECDNKIVGLDSAIVMDPKVWDASGHTSGFSDPVTFSKVSGKRFRVDHLLESVGVSADEKMPIEEIQKLFEENKHKFDADGENPNNLTPPVFFNLLAKTNIGSITGESDVYLRGETCQGIYVNYKNVMDSVHLKIPFGIAQIGKAFRNEISTRQFLFRLREFSQLELEYFCSPDEAAELYEEYKQKSLDFLLKLGINKDKLRFKDHDKLVFYAKAATDIEYEFPFGWKEIQGIHNRGDHDLSAHQEHSKKKLEYFDDASGKKYIPHIIETSMSIERLVLTLLFDSFEVETLKDGTNRNVLKLTHSAAPYKLAILPLMKKPDLQQKGMEIFDKLKPYFSVCYDETQSIGKRYRRQDEIGTPYCITIDFDTLENNTITMRDRDSMEQETIMIENLLEVLTKKFS